MLLANAAAIGHHWNGITVGVVFVLCLLMYHTYLLCMTQSQCMYNIQLVKAVAVGK